MKRKVFFGAILLIAVSLLQAQTDFKVLKEIPATNVKDQSQSGTCWAFAGISFIEAEMLRMGKGNYDLSEMFVVHKAYLEKASSFIKFQGKTNFGPGGQAHDVMNIIMTHGILPETVYQGILYGKLNHDHNELDAIMRAMVMSYLKEKDNGLSLVWQDAIEAVLNVYLGSIPEIFSYEGMQFTAKTFLNETDINPKDYVELTSYLDFPFYEKEVLKIPDNWSFNHYYNLPLNELMEVFDYALSNGFSICWDGDVSGDFNRSTGVGCLSDENYKVDQLERQHSFDNFLTTDDHLMHITGIAENVDGNKYYKTKNSWGTANIFEGYWYLSENYIRMHTVAIMVHKNAIPKHIIKKLNL